MKKQPVDLSQLNDDQLDAEIAKRKKDREAKAFQEKKQYRKDKEYFVDSTIQQFEQAHTLLKNLKGTAIAQANDIYNRMFALHGKDVKEVKQFTLFNEKQDKKIIVSRAEKFGFTEEAVVAIEGIKDFFKSKFEGRSKLVYNLLDTLLIKNVAGDYDPKLLTKLRGQVLEINDATLSANFELLEKSQTVTGTALYLRAYQKNAEGKWQDVVIQFSSL